MRKGSIQPPFAALQSTVFMRLTDFSFPGFSGLVHMSELYLENEPRKAFNTGDRISVIVLDPRDDGKQSFSR